MIKMKKGKKISKRKSKTNIYAWGQKNKRIFAGVICTLIVLGMLVSLLQV